MVNHGYHRKKGDCSVLEFQCILYIVAMMVSHSGTAFTTENKEHSGTSFESSHSDCFSFL